MTWLTVVDFFLSSRGITFITTFSFVFLYFWLKYFPAPPVQECQDTNKDARDERDREKYTTGPKVPKKTRQTVASKPATSRTTMSEPVFVPAAKSVEKVTVNTSFGPVSVTIVGDRKSSARMVTYHDVATNHQTCFNSWVNFACENQLLDQFCYYHVDAPGQESGASELKDKFPSVDDMSRQLSEVVQELDVGMFVGIGVGLGANVLARFAMRNRIRVKALVLADLKLGAQSIWEFYMSLGLMKAISWYGMTDNVKQSLARMHFSDAAWARSPGLIKAYCESLDDMNTANLANMIKSYSERTKIELEELKKSLHDGNIPLLLLGSGPQSGVIPIVGGLTSEAQCLEQLNELRGPLSQDNISAYVVKSSGQLVTEERPADTVGPVSMFLESIGYFVRA